MTGTSSLRYFWSKSIGEEPPFLYKHDDLDFRDHVVVGSREELDTARNAADPNRWHLGLLPVPFMGRLPDASIFILMNHPGFAPSNYDDEQDPDYRSALVRNLTGAKADDEYPFVYLNPAYEWTDGYGYWNAPSKLGGICEALRSQNDWSEEKASRVLAQEVALVHLVPYHSEGTVPPDKGGTMLRSSQAAVNFARKRLKKRADDGTAIVIVVQGQKFWKLPPNANTVVYASGEARAASLGPGTQGGSAIARRFGLSY